MRMLKKSKINPFLPIRVAAAISALIVGAAFCAGPQAWHSNQSFDFLNSLHLPWQVYGVWLILAGIALFFKKVRSLGYLLGAAIYTYFAFTTGLAISLEELSTLFIPCNLTTIAVFYWSALRVSIYDQVDPERKIGRE